MDKRRVTQSVQIISLLMSVITFKISCTRDNTEAEREFYRGEIILSCYNATGPFQYMGVASILFTEYTLTCISHCYIEAEDNMKAIVMLPTAYPFSEMTFPVRTWKEVSLGVTVDTNLLTLSPNKTAFRFNLPRKIKADFGTFQITCIDPSQRTSLPPSHTTQTLPTVSRLASSHIAAIVIVILLLCIVAVVIGAIFLYRRFGSGGFTLDNIRCTLFKREGAPTAGRHPPSKDTLANCQEPKYYNDLTSSKKSDKLYTPLNRESAAVYIDPEQNCSTYEPSFYDNKITAGHSGEYSYTYTEPKYKPQVRPKPKMPKTKQALIPGKPPLSTKQQNVGDKGGFKRQSSEVKYEDVE